MYKQIDSDVDLEQSGLSSGFGAKQKKARRRQSTDESVLEDMKGIMSTFGGGDDSPSGISPAELNEMAAVLKAERGGGLGELATHVEETTPAQPTSAIVSVSTPIEIESDEVSQVTEVPSDDDDEDDKHEGGLELKLVEDGGVVLAEDDSNTVIT
jgi:hypothetical protein